MANENTKSVLEEAVLEMKSILEAADKNAKNKIAKELPEKFESLLSEELKKLKNKESVNESAKDDNEEPHDEGKKEDTDNIKESQNNEMNEMDMRELSIEEVEEAYDMANEEDMFETIDVNDITSEINAMDEMQHEIEEMQDNETTIKKDADNPGDPYKKIKHLYEMMSEMIKEMDDHKMQNELHEEFDSHMKEMYGEAYKEMMGEEKFNEMYEMYASTKKGKKVNESTHMKENNYRDETGQVPGEQGQEPEFEMQGKPKFDYNIDESSHLDENVDPATIAAGVTAAFAAGYGADQLMQFLKKRFPKVAAALEQAGTAAGKTRREYTSTGTAQGKMQNEDMADMQGDFDLDADIDETAGQSRMRTLSRTAGNHALPRNKGQYNKDNAARPAQAMDGNGIYESANKKLKALMSENKNLFKQLKEAKESTAEAETTNEQYKGVLAKYRNQLQEMAVLNTNIAHVNNILIKENDLTINDKKNIVERFKGVESITESENVYKGLLSEMVETKKGTLDESIEDKFNDSIDPSSSKKITEQVVEKTALGSTHLNKIKGMMNYKLYK